jgi:hypothetical protein
MNVGHVLRAMNRMTNDRDVSQNHRRELVEAVRVIGFQQDEIIRLTEQFEATEALFENTPELKLLLERKLAE